MRGEVSRGSWKEKGFDLGQAEKLKRVWESKGIMFPICLWKIKFKKAPS
jgi:hypothetical protein